MSNDIYKILNNFNKLTEQKPESARSPEAKPKTKLQENIEQIDSKYTQYRQTLMEMDKSQKPPGRDGASTDTDAGPQGVAKPIKSSDMARHAGKTLNKAVKKSRGLKETQQGVAEGSLEEVSLDLAKRARDKAEYFVDMDYDDMRYRPYGYSEKQRSKFQRYIDRKEPRAKGDRDWDPPKKKGVAEGTAVPWQVVINALASGYPDSDPTDSLAPIMRKYGVEFDDLNLLARRNGYNDIYAVLDDFGQKQGVAEGSLNEFAPGKQGGDGDYLRTLASAWYNDTFNTGSLQQGIKSQEDVERVLARGIVCPDGKTRKYNIDYNGDFDGVQIYSDDYYEHGDVDGSTDTRTGRPFGPYDHIEFKGQDLDEGVAEGSYDKRYHQVYGDPGENPDFSRLNRYKYDIDYSGGKTYYDVPPDKEDIARQLYMQQDRDGRWYMPSFIIGSPPDGEVSQLLATADSYFGRGEYVPPARRFSNMAEEQQDESALQAYLGKKKYGENGMKALQKAGRNGASKEKMASIRAQHDKMDEGQGVAEGRLNEKAVSRAQQKFMGMVHSAKKGAKPASTEVAKAAKGMSKKAARDFAATKHKGLPQHVNETIIRALQEGYSREQIVAYLLEATDADREYWRELTKNIPQKGEVSRTVHKGHYGTEYQGDDDEDDEDQTKKKIAKPEGEKRGRGRPKGVKNRVVRAGEKKAAAKPAGEKRGRGRPPGAKNKPKMETIVKNERMIAEAYLSLVERGAQIWHSDLKDPQGNPVPAPSPHEPTYKVDPKTGEYVPDIPKPQAPPKPRQRQRQQQKPQQKPAPKSEVDTDTAVAEETDFMEMMKLAGLSEKLHGKQHRLDVDRDGKLEKSDFAKLRSRSNEEQLDEKMYFDPATGQTTDRTFKPPMAQSAPVDNTQFKADVDRAKSGLTMKPGDSTVYSRERGLGPSMAADRLEKRGVDIPGLVGNRVNPTTMDAGPGMNEDDMEEGNEFSGALAKAKESGAKEFKVDGKTYPVRESKLDECGEMGPMANGMTDQQGKINVSTNMSSDGNKSVTVTADGDAALELMQILSLAGMQNHNKMQQPEIAIAAMEEKDTRYEASTTPEEDVLPLETQLKGGDGEVAGKEKKMNKHGSARFSDNPLAAEEMKESISLKMMKEYEGIKIKS